MWRSDLAMPAEPNSGTKETTKEREVSDTYCIRWAPTAHGFVTTDKDLSGKEGRDSAGNMALRLWWRGRAIPPMWTSSQHLLPNQRDVVNRINSFNKDGTKRIFSSLGRRANQWEQWHPPSSWGRAHPLCAVDEVPWIHCSSTKSSVGGRTSIFLREGCWATGKLSAGRWRLRAHAPPPSLATNLILMD